MSSIAIIKEKYARLESVNQTLIKDVSGLSQEELKFHPDHKSWCIIQVLEHVKNAELGTLLYIRKKMKYGGIKDINWTSGIRTFLMNVINNSPIRFKMPSVLPQPTDSGTLDQIIADWGEIRKKWHTLIDEFPEEYKNKAIFRHPIFGRLSLSQTMDSMISHQNHHIKQINRIRRAMVG